MDQLFNEAEVAIQDSEGVASSTAVDAPNLAQDASDLASDEPTFGVQLTKLEDIVRKLESGQLELEDSLKNYEEGVSLIQGLQAKLDAAEQKVQVMMGEISQEEE